MLGHVKLLSSFLAQSRSPPSDLKAYLSGTKTKDPSEVVWSAQAVQAFETVKQHLVEQPLYKILPFLACGRPFTVFTNHKPLSFALKQKPVFSPTLATELYQPVHFGHPTCGKEKVVADALSRISKVTVPAAVDSTAIVEAQKDDVEL